MKITENLIEKIDHMKERVFLSVLFLAAFIFRLPTLFNDFYDVDELAAIVQTREYLAGLKPVVDFSESKLPLYHSIFKFSYSLNEVYGWVIVHIITIFFVFFTALAVYYIGILIRDRKTGMIAALLYAVLISSFNRHFMATNGEVIYNLPIAAGLLFFLLLMKNRLWYLRVFYAILTVVSIYAAMMVKFHGVILLLFIGFFLIIYLPYYLTSLKRVIIPYIILAVSVLAVFAFDYFITKKFAADIIYRGLHLLFYATASRSSNPLYMIGIYTLRQFTLGAWHFVLWIPAAVYMFSFIKNRFRKDTREESAVALFALITFLMVFAGGARVYYHYFMTSYPYLCLIAAVALTSSDNSVVKRVKNSFAVALLIPGLFFFSWNVKDIYIKYFNQNLFYNEPKALFWFRAIAVSSMDDYLLPNGAYVNAVNYIRNNTKPSDRIFVWGDGPHLYYFSDRRIAIHHVWPKGGAIRIEKLYSKNKTKSTAQAEMIESGIITMIEKRKAELFIDTSPKGLHRGITKFGSFAKYPYDVPPLMRKYLNEHFKLETVVDDYKIYRRVK
jgi:hypothetical protein